MAAPTEGNTKEDIDNTFGAGFPKGFLPKSKAAHSLLGILREEDLHV